MTIEPYAGFPRADLHKLTGEAEYMILGAATYEEACDFAGANVPGALSISALGFSIPRASLVVEPITPDFEECKAIAQYGNDVRPLSTVQTEAQSVARVSFSINTQTRKRYFSEAVVSRYGRALDAGNLIGVSNEGLDGVDVFEPTGELNLPVFMPATTVSHDYIAKLQRNAGKVTNLTAYAGFARGELLFLGASGDQQKNGDWEVTFRMGISPNESGIIVQAPAPYASLTGIKKKGWEYLDVLFHEVEATAAEFPLVLKVPVSARVHQVFKEAEFRTLLRIPGI